MCSSPSAAGVAIRTTAPASITTDFRDKAETAEWLEEHKVKMQEIERAAAEQTERDVRTEQLNNVIQQLRALVGETPYVFSGSTPAGWDCSGMVMWAYEKLGVALEHRASKQKYAGEFVDEPKVGDIVAFSYGDGAFHTGIWLAPDTMIHAGGQAGDRTEIIPISTFEAGSTVTYTRLLDTN